MTRLYFLHGLESNPNGYKATTLRNQYPDLIAPALPKDPWQRQEILAPAIEPGAILVGSSLGGLSALICARDFPERIEAMVLLAPAVGFYQQEYRTQEVLDLVNSLIVPPSIPCTILAAKQDDVIPLEAIHALIERSKGASIELFELDEGHRLNSPKAHQHMLDAVANYVGGHGAS